MALKPTYKELQQKVKMLEGEVSDLKKSKMHDW